MHHFCKQLQIKYIPYNSIRDNKKGKNNKNSIFNND